MGCGVTKNQEVKSIVTRHKGNNGNPLTDPEKANKDESSKKMIIDAGHFAIKNPGKLSENYSQGVKIGQSSKSFVRLAVHKFSSQKRAIKSIEKKSINSEEQMARFINEINILKMIDHPNVVKLHEFYEDDMHVHLVTEYVPGGELFDFIVSSGKLYESIAANFMQQVLSALAYCHNNNIIHRNLKPEHLLLDRAGSGAIVKVIDFGTSVMLSGSNNLSKKAFNSFYAAPEVLANQDYNEKCDIWSCGVILYILLSGKLPFSGKKDSDIIKKIISGKYSLSIPEWSEVSDRATDLVKKMLELNPKRRISARDALEHPWITFHNNQNSSQEKESGSLALKNLQCFRIEQKLQYAVTSFIASNLISKEESKQMYENFKRLDKNNDGKLSAEELLQACKGNMNKEEAADEVRRIMNSVDSNNSGFIDYSEFVTACLQKEMMVNNKNLEVAFKAFDIDGSGKISVNELKEILGLVEVDDESVAKLISSVDRDGDGFIDIEEFKQMMVQTFQ